MTHHTCTATMSDQQISDTFKAGWEMLENYEDHAPQLEHTFLGNYWNEERKCCEAWITDGNPIMGEAIKYELIFSYKPT